MSNVSLDHMVAVIMERHYQAHVGGMHAPVKLGRPAWRLVRASRGQRVLVLLVELDDVVGRAMELDAVRDCHDLARGTELC